MVGACTKWASDDLGRWQRPRQVACKLTQVVAGVKSRRETRLGFASRSRSGRIPSRRLVPFTPGPNAAFKPRAQAGRIASIAWAYALV